MNGEQVIGNCRLLMAKLNEAWGELSSERARAARAWRVWLKARKQHLEGLDKQESRRQLKDFQDRNPLRNF
jgi:hypothetical protein